ncbi:homeodomain-containing [Pyrenophora seminiperda CCB06]|uniref:Homeodomain-containing n=1 Tax=Pyrenophora seminiperda CCB06 TaxID=1302712 RepID=A0A3M7M582_9PLEO|nr:homeodomain-containing [Pyrenophora seminiperda CCB06]
MTSRAPLQTFEPPDSALNQNMAEESTFKLPPTNFKHTNSQLPKPTYERVQPMWSFYLPPLPSSSPVEDADNHHMRSSPPLQPGEQNFPGKLPSFSEFLHTTRTNTPPRTPQRRNESVDSSPHVQPHFDDVAWNETKRRRVDTLGDIYARPVEQPMVESRRMSSAIDPALGGYSPRVAQQHVLPPAASSMHHRASLSYPPPHQPLNPNMRHASSPGPPPMAFSQSYAQQPVSQGPHQPPMPLHGPMYEHRHSYHREPQAAVYGSYERPQEVYYARTSYGGYDSSYGDIRFQQHVGLDHNSFNRKRRGNLPKEATNMLKDWFQQNRQSPYPTEDQKMDLCSRTGLSLNQVSNWFINARRRAPQKEQREREANGPEA